MSQMPDKIWLHKDTKYNTGDIVSAYQYEFVQGIEDEGGIENFVEYVPADAFIEKACKFIKDNGSHYIDIVNGQLVLKKCIIKDFKKYMEDSL